MLCSNQIFVHSKQILWILLNLFIFTNRHNAYQTMLNKSQIWKLNWTRTTSIWIRLSHPSYTFFYCVCYFRFDCMYFGLIYLNQSHYWISNNFYTVQTNDHLLCVAVCISDARSFIIILWTHFYEVTCHQVNEFIIFYYYCFIH